MDFSKIKPAVEDISLNDEQMEQIINNCKIKKKKPDYKPLVAAAAAAVIIVAVFSPGFLFRAKTADTAENGAMQSPAEDYHMLADEDIYYYSENSGAGDMPAQDICIFADITAFETDEFTELYYLVPSEFLHHAGDNLNSWISSVSADNGMAMMQFVKDFNIPREDFDSANLAFAARTGNYFDADLIYTFDKNKIDDFYRK